MPSLALRPAPSVTTPSTYPLPPDLAAKGVRRIGFIGLIAAVMGPIVYLAELRLQPARVASPGPVPLAEIGTALLFLPGLAVFLIAWSRRAPVVRVLDLGLLFEVVGALGIALSEHATPYPAGEPVRGISWNCVWITIFVVAVPGTYGKTVLAAIAAALMAPVGLAVATLANGLKAPGAEQMLAYLLPNFAAAGWAIPIAKHLHSLRAQVSKAREMGSYRLVEKIGTGGMGEVWRAEHRLLARPAAIKLIRPEILGAANAAVALRRFEREARAMSALRSPHTVALYDYGVTDEGRFYYVMELLDGVDLEALVSRYGPQPPARAVRLLRQVCLSLAEAHERGLVHRDVKPRNIVACRAGVECDFVKVLDFGLAKHAGDGAETRLTAGGMAAGTPAFVAPETALGRRVDGRADLYGLGCVGYWLLTGQLVFPRDTPVAMIMAHVQDSPPPPRERVEVAVPPDLERIVLDCLEKDPDRRPRNARELEARLAACDAGRWTAEDAQRWWQLQMPVEVYGAGGSSQQQTL